MSNELKAICSKYLVNAYRMGQKVDPMSTDNSEYYLPMIDLDIAPKMVEEILSRPSEPKTTEAVEIYEVRDVTDEERYFPLGIYLSIQDAVGSLIGAFEPDSHHGEWTDDSPERFEIYERKIGTSCNGKLVWEIERDEKYSDEKDEYLYETTLNRAICDEVES